MTPQYSHLLPPSWKSQISAWLDEDTSSFDYGGFVVGEAPREAFRLRVRAAHELTMRKRRAQLLTSHHPLAP